MSERAVDMLARQPCDAPGSSSLARRCPVVLEPHTLTVNTSERRDAMGGGTPEPDESSEFGIALHCKPFQSACPERISDSPVHLVPLMPAAPTTTPATRRNRRCPGSEICANL